MNCNKCGTLLTKPDEKTLCMRCGRDVLRNPPVRSPIKDVFEQFAGDWK